MRVSQARRACARLLVVAMFGALLALVPATSARALTIEVTTTADGVGGGTLRAAMDDANAAATGPVVISVPEGAYDLTRCGGIEDANVWADLDHLGDLDLTIVGQGSGATIRSTCDDRVIDQHGTGVLTLSNLTVTGGVAFEQGSLPTSFPFGGGVRANGSVHLDSTAVDGNNASGGTGGPGQKGGDARGAGIWAAGGLVATNSAITNNWATGGLGGVCHQALPTVGGGAMGGGAFVLGDVALTGTVVADNRIEAERGQFCFTGYGPGSGTAIGAGIYGAASVTVDHSQISRNQAFAADHYHQMPLAVGDTAAAGVAALGAAHVADSTFDANFVGSPQGGVRGSAAWSAGAMTVERSTFGANRLIAEHTFSTGAGDGATVASATSVSATNVTFSGNDVLSAPYAIAVTVSSPTIDLVHVTVDGDVDRFEWPEPRPAGGLFFADTMSMRASALHPDPASTSAGCRPTGAHSSGGDNWATDASCGLTDPTDVVVADGDPQLGAIADNGGPTKTLLPQPGSPLIDAVPADRCAVAQDQRGAPRPAGAGCDVGAVEAGGIVPPTTTTTTTSTSTTSTTTTSSASSTTTTTTSTTSTSTTIPTTTSTTSTTLPTTTTTATPPPSGSKFHAVAPRRVLDSRTGKGWSGKLVTGVPRTLQVAGAHDVPATADAVVLNVTVTGGNANSFLTAYPAGTTVPPTSNLNFATGQTTPNLVTVKVGTGGGVAFANALGSVDVIADLVGYYDPSAAGGLRYNPVTPVRTLDSRIGTGWSGTLVASAPRALQVSGNHGVPATAGAAVLNVTATGGSANSFLTVYPTGGPVPNASNLNFAMGETVPNLVTVKLGTEGKVSFANAVGAVHVVADLVGYFDANTGAYFHVLAPTRALDSRTGAGWSGALAKGAPRSLQVTGANGIPPGAHAILANTTATAGTANSFVTVYPTGTALPTASTLNFGVGQTIANLAAIKVGDGGKATFANAQGSVHVVADLVGYYA